MWIFPGTLLLLSSIYGVSAVRIRLLDVPQMARVGHTVHLTCDYDLERQRLYQVKWYKGSHEFYRYSPGEPERQKLFLVKNLHVDLQRSDDRTIVLRDLHVDMTGKYTCEVSTEGIFETVKDMAKMTVIALPVGGPHIQGVQQDVKLGEYITLNCTSLKSKPAANLTFYINGRNAAQMRKVELTPALIVNADNDPQRESSILSMNFKVRKHHVHEGRVGVRCEASILNIYQRGRDKEIFVRTGHNSHAEKNTSTNHQFHSLAVSYNLDLIFLMTLIGITNLA